LGVDDRVDDFDVGVEGLVPPVEVGVEGLVRTGAVPGDDLDLDIPFGVVELGVDSCLRGLGLPRLPLTDSAGEYVDDLRDFEAEEALLKLPLERAGDSTAKAAAS
jgi:hypothetical protein